jgi:hypothetical protein
MEAMCLEGHEVLIYFELIFERFLYLLQKIAFVGTKTDFKKDFAIHEMCIKLCNRVFGLQKCSTFKVNILIVIIFIFVYNCP